jgi:site-specific DNA-methyltransferase (adenine-specific)
MITAHHGDCLEVIPRLVAEGVVCDAVVTDPPYGLNFMGQQWDGGDIAFSSKTWAAVAAILRPGAFLVAFGGTRTYHRLVCAIEDAGFVIQDTIAWLYGSGFPKHRDMLKPAFEPIVLAYKPGGKRTMQVDECRIPSDGPIARGTMHTRGKGSGSWVEGSGSWAEGRIFTVTDDPMLGRWPANVCHDGSEEVTEAFPDSAGQQGDIRGTEASATGDNGIYGHFDRVGFAARNDTGSAARFFFSAKANAQDRWGSRHPTVKPVELMKWLVRLVTPPGGLVLDPFAGSGTTGVAALATGRRAILIEREAQYHADIRERLAFYEGGGTHSMQAKNRNRSADAGPLFAEAR